jgi:hypothetical protein
MDDADSQCSVDNPFSSETLTRDISLSVYNTPKKLVEVKERPVITQDYLLRGMKGYKPPVPKGEEGEAPPEVPTGKAQRESILPEINTDVGEMITKDANDRFRQDQLEELYSVQSTLAQAKCDINFKVLQRALFVPEELVRKPGEFSYPSPIATLMKSPFPKKEKKKKGKKKK